LRARIDGVYAYDPSTKKVHSTPATTFSPEQPFAAKVDWSSLPPNVRVGAHWYNSLEQEIGGVGPSLAGDLARKGALVVEKVPVDGADNLPGEYTMVVARYSRNQAVE